MHESEARALVQQRWTREQRDKLAASLPNALESRPWAALNWRDRLALLERHDARPGGNEREREEWEAKEKAKMAVIQAREARDRRAAEQSDVFYATAEGSEAASILAEAVAGR